MSSDTVSGGLFERLESSGLSLRYVLGLLGLVFMAVLPLLSEFELGIGIPGVFVFAVDNLLLLKLTGALYFGMFAMSWDVVSGYTGQISFGHGVFFAVGGYTSALLNIEFGIAPALAVPVGVVLAAVTGLVIGVPALRLRGPYLSLVTLVAPLILLNVFIWQSGTFGGERGLLGEDYFLGLGSDAALEVYYIALVLFTLIFALLFAVTRSDAGRVFTAIREDEDAVAAAGLNPAKFKTFAFVLSAAVGGLAGAMFVHSPVGGARPSELMSVIVNVEVIIAAILGGMGTIVGAAIGGVFLILLQDGLSNLGDALTIPIPGTETGVVLTPPIPFSQMDFLLFAVITLVLLLVLPGGIVRAGIRGGRRVLRRVRSDREDPVATDGGRVEDSNDGENADAGRAPERAVYRNYRDALEGDDDEH
ncbi:branched-chain amino acid ABC transporter permease [Halomarina ordinaria]|uniref:Branched-chain amino acid ABC transporter permease n=1 Tax=Halomarina ordinaria TaxID=3033939 RepID=A0ABD5U6B6_9EURY|nr:branched-chain amino acid ABC transporter permease [Halomarina sp. PSRA2]